MTTRRARISHRNGNLPRAAVLACALACAAIAVPASAAPGDLDAGFSGDGRLTMDLNGRSMAFDDVLTQPGGKVLAVGWANTTSPSQGSDFVLARFGRDGSLDGSFSGDGIETTDLGGDERAVAVAVQPDGKVVVAGESYRQPPGSTGQMDFALARYRPNGSLDSSFSGDGTLTTDLGGGWDLARDVAVGPGGELLVAGTSWSFATQPERSAFAVARYRPDGSRDPSFSDDGTTTVRAGRGDNEAHGLVVRNNGRIVVAGSTGHFALLGLRPDGRLDHSFSGDGVARTRFRRGWSEAQAIASHRGGRLIAAGRAASGAKGKGTNFALARYSPNGRLDASFSRDGRTTTGFGEPDEGASDLAIYAKGKIVAVGSSGVADGAVDFALARHRRNGTLDRRFGRRGRVRTRFGKLMGRYACSGAAGVALGQAGSVVAAGRVFSCDAADTDDSAFLPAAVARYEG